MKAFHRRWEQLVARNRHALATKTAGDAAPGFASRVVTLAAQARDGGAQAWVLELWIRRTRQALAVVALLGLAMVAFERTATRHNRLSHPGIENTVAQLLWRL